MSLNKTKSDHSKANRNCSHEDKGKADEGEEEGWVGEEQQTSPLPLRIDNSKSAALRRKKVMHAYVLSRTGGFKTNLCAGKAGS